MTQLVTIKVAAHALGVSRSTLRTWEKKGKFKSYRHPANNYRMYKFDEILDYIKGYTNAT